MRVHSLRFATAFGMLLALSGCITPHGPIAGDWSGRQIAGDGLDPRFVTIVLHGSPGDRSGQYDFNATTSHLAFSNVGGRNLRWSDRWTLTQQPGPGAPMILDLRNLPNSQISSYALLGNGVLVPLTKDGQPDTSRYGLHYALPPVPESNYSYGRA